MNKGARTYCDIIQAHFSKTIFDELQYFPYKTPWYGSSAFWLIHCLDAHLSDPLMQSKMYKLFCMSVTTNGFLKRFWLKFSERYNLASRFSKQQIKQLD